MPKILCRCKNEIDLISIPCPDGFELISEADLNSLYRIPPSRGDDFLEHFRRLRRQVYRCPHCGRLLVFWNKDEATFYQPE